MEKINSSINAGSWGKTGGALKSTGRAVLNKRESGLDDDAGAPLYLQEEPALVFWVSAL